MAGVDMGEVERRIRELGITLPDFGQEGYYGTSYGKMRPHHQVGSLLFLSGHVPERNGTIVYPGRLGETVTIEQGYEAARLVGINCLAGIKLAVGDLDRVVSLVRSLCFVVCTPSFYEVHKVSSGATDLFADVLGDRGIGGRATIGVNTLAKNHCFELWLTVEVE
jgi:enamine deaminase RidA (YjgF/YER057c/UK114 family)